MLSLETKELANNKFWCMFRYWDGYDKPDYFKIFPITQEEMNFFGGRFDRYHFTLDLKLTKQPVRVNYLETTVNATIEEIVNWIHENTTDNWFMDVNDDIYPPYRFSFWFANDKDRFKFALTWK